MGEWEECAMGVDLRARDVRGVTRCGVLWCGAVAAQWRAGGATAPWGRAQHNVVVVVATVTVMVTMMIHGDAR